MRTSLRRYSPLAPLGLLVLIGCAAVNPRPDFERAEREVHQTVGHGRLAPLADDPATALEVQRLLQDGLTADEAIQIALLNNPRLQAALLDIGLARADVVQAGLFTNPSVYVSFRFPDGGGLSNLEASIAQNIADLWLIPSRRRAAERELDRTILQTAREAAEVAWNAKTAYFRAVRAVRAHEIARENRSLTGRVLELARARQAAGSGSEIDVNLARTQGLERDVATRRAALAETETRTELARLLGLGTPAAELVLAEDLPAAHSTDVTEERLLDVARASRLDLRAADAVVAAAEARAVQERRRFINSVEIGLSLEREERRPPDRPNLLGETVRSSLAAGQLSPPEFEPRPEQSQDLILGPSIGLEVPLFDQNQAQIARADYAVLQAQRTRAALLLELAQDARLSLARLESATALVRFFEQELLPAEERSVELARDAYRAGRTLITSVLAAESMYLNARAQHVEALETAALAIIELERTAGRPIRELTTFAAPAEPPASQPADAGGMEYSE